MEVCLSRTYVQVGDTGVCTYLGVCVCVCAHGYMSESEHVWACSAALPAA